MSFQHNQRLGLRKVFAVLLLILLATEVLFFLLVSCPIKTYSFAGTNAHCIIDDAYHYLAERGIMGRTHTVQHPMPQIHESLSTDSGVWLEVCLLHSRAA